MVAGLPGRQLRAGEKGGSGVGKTKVGKGSKVMVVVDGQGLPLGLHLGGHHPIYGAWHEF
ncbi:MAG: hypothetical protein QXI12_06530 [Candidatus Methanomethyliaceae archaeon]